MAVQPSQLVAKALADANKTGWAQVDRRETLTGLPEPLISTQESGLSMGWQAVRGDGADQVVEVLPSGVYFQGNSDVLNNTLDLPSPDASLLSGWWLSLGPTDKADAEFDAGVTLRSVLGQVRVSSSLSETGPMTVEGKTVVAISGNTQAAGGTKPLSATLYISSTSNPLPVEFVRGGTGSGQLTAVFSHWGRAVDITAPGNPVPLVDEGGKRFLPVPAAPKLPAGLCLDYAPPGSPPATWSYVAASNAVVEQWIAIAQAIETNNGVSQLQNYSAEADADSLLLGSLRRIDFTGQTVALARNFEMYLSEYIDQLELIVRSGVPSSGASKLNLLDNERGNASGLLRSSLGLTATYSCQWLRPKLVSSSTATVAVRTSGALPGASSGRAA